METALDIISEGGVDSFSMSNTARALNVSVMALYTYFTSREALLEAAADYVFAKFHVPAERPDWRSFIVDWTCALDRELDRHPAARSLLSWGGRVSPAWLRVWMPVLRVLRQQGLQGTRLVFAGDWFGAAAFQAINGHQQQVDAKAMSKIFAATVSPDDKRILNDILDNMSTLDRDELFSFSVQGIIRGLEALIDAPKDRS